MLLHEKWIKYFKRLKSYFHIFHSSSSFSSFQKVNVLLLNTQSLWKGAIYVVGYYLRSFVENYFSSEVRNLLKILSMCYKRRTRFLLKAKFQNRQSKDLRSPLRIQWSKFAFPSKKQNNKIILSELILIIMTEISFSPKWIFLVYS